MFNELIKCVGIHAVKHPKETIAAVATAGELVGPVAIAAGPFVLTAAAIAGTIYLISKC